MTMPTFTDGVVVHQASLNSLSTGINNLSTYVLGAAPPRSYVPMVALRQASVQSVPNASDTLVNWDTADANNDNMWTGSSPNVVTVRTAGTYAFWAQGTFAANGTNDRYMWLLMNGTNAATNSIAESHQPGYSGIDGNLLGSFALMPSLAVGATFYVDLWQNAGGAINTGTGRACSRLYAWRIGP